MQNLVEESAVRRLIAKFANSGDLKEWEELGTCLADSVYGDYSDRLSTPPLSMSKEEFIQSQRAELEGMKTHHLLGNFEVFINGTSATARLSALLYRRHESGETTRAHCVYLVGLQFRHDAWVIGSIVQKILWIERADNRS